MQLRYKHLSQFGYSKNSWLVYRADEPKKHSHVSSKGVALKLISIISKGYLPTSRYLLKSAEKLLTTSEFEQLKPFIKKQQYRNVGIKKTSRQNV